jgi:hypothetical protein
MTRNEFIAFPARFDSGECPICGWGIAVGDLIGYDEGDLVHQTCFEEENVGREKTKEFRPTMKKKES